MNHLNLLLTSLKAKGLNAQTVAVGADSHWDVFKTAPDDALIVDIYGGMDPGIIYEKGDIGYKRTLGNRRDALVYIFSHSTMPLITNRLWLARDKQDNYDDKTFTGIAHPDLYVRTQGVSYIEGVTFANITPIVTFIAHEAALVASSLTVYQVQDGINRVNAYYELMKILPKTVSFPGEILSFEDFTRLVVYKGLNYDFLQYGMASVTTEPVTGV